MTVTRTAELAALEALQAQVAEPLDGAASDRALGGGPPSAENPMDDFVRLLRRLYPIWERDRAACASKASE